MDFSGIVDFFRFLLNSEDIIQYGGLTLITLIVFAENGLFFAFFLPGDYLLFLAGLFGSTRQLDFPLFTIILCIVIAAILGSYTGYFSGRLIGSNLEHRKESLFYKKRHLEESRTFFNRYGGKALVLARFMPIVRTFSPIIAGTIGMKLRIFSMYNVLGALAWGVSLPAAGFYLGQTFPEIINYVEWIIVFFIGITSIALLRTFIKMRRKRVQTQKGAPLHKPIEDHP
jgi:membrane-associated protein